MKKLSRLVIVPTVIKRVTLLLSPVERKVEVYCFESFYIGNKERSHSGKERTNVFIISKFFMDSTKDLWSVTSVPGL